MRRLLLLILLWLMPVAHARAADPAWETCRGAVGADGPVLTDCRPLDGPIDPQGREIWIRSSVAAPGEARPHALYVVGVASSEAWLNGQRLGANGQPGPTAEAESSGRYQIALPVPETLWRPGDNELVLRLSSFHGGLPFSRPIGAAVISPFPWSPPLPLLAITFVAAGALFAAAFGFGAIHAQRRTGSSLILAVMAGVAGLQAVVESLRSLVGYAYPLHVWRVGTIWLLAAVFGVLLTAYVASRFWPGARQRMVAAAVVIVGATALLPGFDLKTGMALFLGVALAAVAAGAGVRRRTPGARLTLGWLVLFMGLAVAFPEWLVDLSYFLLAAGLILPLLMVEVVRLGRDDRRREAALTRAVGRPDRLTVASARGVELVPLNEIIAAVGADDYVELRLEGGRRLLHATRLEKLAEELPPTFIRVHRSAIASLAHVRVLERDGDRWRLRMSSGETLPVSRSRLPAVRDALDDAVPVGAQA